VLWKQLYSENRPLKPHHMTHHIQEDGILHSHSHESLKIQSFQNSHFTDSSKFMLLSVILLHFLPACYVWQIYVWSSRILLLKSCRNLVLWLRKLLLFIAELPGVVKATKI